MSANERAAMQRKLSEFERELIQLDIRVSCDVDEVRTRLNKNIVDDVAQLDVDGAMDIMTTLQANVHKMRDLKKRRDEIRKELGV